MFGAICGLASIMSVLRGAPLDRVWLWCYGVRF